MPVEVYAHEKGWPRGGEAFAWGRLDVRLRKGVQLRMVNVGPRTEVRKGRLGHQLCLACGQSHSPYASTLSRQKFEQTHAERCGHRIEPTGFYADLEVDALGLHGVEDPVLAYSVAEAMRMGAARVLDMEVEDLQLLGLGHATDDARDVLLYDPMPGGSGLLDQLAARWNEVRAAALEIVEHCPAACDKACVDCLHTYRNRFYQQYLDRNRAAELLRAPEEPLRRTHAPWRARPSATSSSSRRPAGIR
jgi:hypothetical protein